MVHKLAELKRKIEGHDGAIHSLFEAIRQLMAPPAPGYAAEGNRLPRAGGSTPLPRFHEESENKTCLTPVDFQSDGANWSVRAARMGGCLGALF
jgi:hypothetical protein